MKGLPIKSYTRAAVLIALFPGPKGWSFPLILRTEGGHYHSGQMGLPGGRLKAGETDEQAALREAQEEVGLDPDEVEVVGCLSQVPIPVSEHLVMPHLGLMKREPEWVLQASEVAELHKIPLAELLEQRNLQQMTMDTREGERRVPYFALDGQKVWGATAIMLAELRALLD